MDVDEQIKIFKEFVEQNYYPQLLETVRRGESSLVLDFSELIKFNSEITEEILEKPEELLKAGELAIRDFDLPKKLAKFNLRFDGLPESQKVKISDIRSKHLNKYIWMEGIVRQKSNVRPHVTTAKFECPSCGNILNVLQLDSKYKEPSRCGCGRKGKFKEISKELIDGQGLVLEESPEDLGGAQAKRINVFLKGDLVSPITERKSNPGSRIKLVGWVTEVPINLRTGGRATKYDLIVEANHIKPVEDDLSNANITKKELEEINKIAKSAHPLHLLAQSIAPSIYGHDKIKEALVLQLLGGCRKKRPDGVVTRGDTHILLIGDPGAGKCVSGDTKIMLESGEIITIKSFNDNYSSSDLQNEMKIISINERGQNFSAIPTYFWKRKAPQQMLKVITNTGNELIVTEDHPLFTTNNAFVFAKEAKNYQTGEYIALPSKINIKGLLQAIPSNIKKTTANNKVKYVIKKTFDQDFARLLGYLVGDGYVRFRKTTGLISFTNKNQNLLNDFEYLIKKVFDLSVSKRRKQNTDCYEYYVSSIELVRILEQMDPQIVKNSEKMCLSKIITKSPNYIIKEFLKSLFDCEGHVNKSKREIELSSKSKNLIYDLKYVLLRFGIISQLSSAIKWATNTINKTKRKYYRLRITGEEVDIFAKEIGFVSIEKTNSLNYWLEKDDKRNTNIKIIPNIKKILTILRKKYNLTQSSFDIPRSTYQHYERGDRFPSYQNLKNVANKYISLNVEDPLIKILKEASSADIFWDKIRSIEKIESNDAYVYDLEIDQVHNFVANGIMVHNSQLLKRISKVAPKARFTSGKGASLDYQEPILVKEKGVLKIKKIGGLVEENCIDKEGVFLPFKNNLQALAFNPKTLKLEWKKIDYGYKHKTKELLYEIELETGRSVVVTGDHSIFGVEEGNLNCKEASKLKKGDTLVIPATIKNKGNFNNKNIACLLGYFIAEGNARSKDSSYKIEFTLHKKELDIIKEIENCSKKLFNKIPKIYKKGDNGITVIIYGKEAHDKLKKWLGSTYGKRAKEKRVPSIIFNMDLESQKEFIRTYIKGDAGVTKSKELMSDLLYLFLNQNIIAGCNKREDNRPRKISNRIIKAEGLRFDLKSPHPNKKYNHQYKSIPLTAIDSEIRKKHCKTIVSSKYCRFNWERISHPKILERFLFIGKNQGVSGPELTKKYTKPIMGYILKNPNLYICIKRGRTKYVYLTNVGKKLYHKLNNCKSLSESDFGFCRIKKIKRVKSTNSYVYDISIKEFENFVAGFGGVICHNTAAGLTASVVKDEFLGGWSLEAGTLVLANRGFAIIDEMDKMGKEDRSALHEAMEQQQISISKANIQATLRCETSLLAAANPKFGRFDPYDLVANQINLPPTLINRFDLIFPIKDLPNREKDDLMATFILKLHKDPKGAQAEISTELLKKYFSYVRTNINPKMSDSAIEEIKEYYVSMRNSGISDESGVKSIPITARQLEALVRLSEASAKSRLAKVVTKKDAQKAIELVDYCLNQIAKDSETGKIDIDRLGSKITATQRSSIGIIKDLIHSLEEQLNNKIISVEQIIELAQEKNISSEQVEEVLEKLRRSGDIFEPKRGFVQSL